MLRWQLTEAKSIPDVQLINYLKFDERNIASGRVTGFVLFDDKTKQPKDLRQYIQIEASSDFKNGKQVFLLTDIIKMKPLSPRFLEPIDLFVQSISNGVVTLADNGNNLYFIDKETSDVSTFDSTKDTAKLITSDSKFWDLMRTSP